MENSLRVRIFVGEDERYRGRPLFEAVVLAAHGFGIAGATVFKGFMGYAPNADVVATAAVPRLAENLPVVVDIVDKEEKVMDFLPFLEEAVGTGMVICSEVQAEQAIPEEGP